MIFLNKVSKLLIVISIGFSAVYSQSTSYKSEPIMWLDLTNKSLDSNYTKLKENTWQITKTPSLLFYRELADKGSKTQIVFVEWASKNKFNINWLWSTLDQISQGADWFELNSKTPNELKPYIDSQASQHWIAYSHSDWTYLAELRKVHDANYLRVIPLNIPLNKNTSPLTWSEQNFPQEDFIGNDFKSCYKKENCKLTHRAESNLEVQTTKNMGLKVQYLGQKSKGFSFPINCLSLEPNKRILFAENLKMYIDLELESAFMSLIQPLGDFWSWYPWDWRSQKSIYSPKAKELEFYALQCVLPSTINLWSQETAKGTLIIHNDLMNKSIFELRLK